MAAGAKVNKMPGTLALGRKDQLWKNYKTLQTKFGPKMFDFLPETFNIPEDWDLLVSAMTGSKEPWIAKPTASSCGDGITVVTEPGQITLGRSVLSVQKYISDPFLINGLKFDLRLYVLLTNIDPVKIYLYSDGIVRFATKQYSMKEETIDDKYIHLTNYSVNKRNEDFVFNEAPDELNGHKWSLKMLWKYFETQGLDHCRVWDQIKDIVVKTIICGHTSIKKAFKENVNSDYNCYKLFGFDVILDASLKPWLLEVNNFPTLNHKSLDRHVNEAMIAEMFNILGFHITEPLTNKRKKAIGDRNAIESWVEFDSQMYARKRNNNDSYKDENNDKSIIFDESKLNSADIRVLIKSEDELDQTVNFTRLLPCAGGQKYISCFQEQSYSDNLLQHWESKYGMEDNRGREVLIKLCQEEVHIKDFVCQRKNNKSKCGIKKILIG